MPDLEKAIRVLGRYANNVFRYNGELVPATDVIALLEAQEPVKPIDENYWKHTMGRCGHCKAPLPAIEGLRSKFCWMCGRPVKWDD